MTDAFDNLESARATVEGQLEQARARNAAVTALAAEVAATSATVTSPNGAITVTATAAAAVSEVTFSKAALDLAPHELGALVTQTIARAQRAAAELALTAAETALGADSGFVSGLRADVDARFAPSADDGTLH